MRNLYLRISVVAAIFAIASCSETAVQPEKVTDSEVTLSINATFDNTKTYIEHDGSAYHANWHKGDVLSIAIDNDYSGRKSFTNASENGETAYFTGSVKDLTAGDHTLSGFYPKEITVNRSGAAFEITIPSVQTMPSLSSFDKSADILIGKPTTVNIDGTTLTSVDMPFRRAGSILKIIPVDNTGESLLNGLKISSIRIESASDIITGRSLKCCIDNSADDELVSGKGSTSITVNYAGEDFNINGTNAAYAIVAPNKFSSGVQLTIDITTNDDNVTIHKVVTPSSDINLTAGMVKPLQIKINDADVTVNTEPTLTILKSSFTDVPSDAATLNVAEAYSLSNCVDANVTVTCDGEVVTSASISEGTINYTISKNTGNVERVGYIYLKLGENPVQTIEVHQLYPGQSHIHVFYIDSENQVVSTTDGVASDYFTVSGSTTLKVANSSYFGTESYTVGALTFDYAKKIDSSNNVTFTTPKASTITYYAASRSTSETQAWISLVTTANNKEYLGQTSLTSTDNVSDLVKVTYTSTADTQYTFAKNKEVGLFYIVVEEN